MIPIALDSTLPRVPPTAPDVLEALVEQLTGWAPRSATGIPERVRDLWVWHREHRAPDQLSCVVPAWACWLPLRRVSATACAQRMAIARWRARQRAARAPTADAAELARIELIHEVPPPELVLAGSGTPTAADAAGR